MKELSVEEKARAYDEALERAKTWQEHLYDVNDKDYADELNYIFPELAESEDEKTKRILHSISSKMSFHLCDIFTEEEFQCFDTWSNAWLNKQSEKKVSYIDMSLVDAVRFCVADNLAHKSTDDNGNTIGFGVYIDDTTAQKLTNELSDIFQKPIEWSEDDKTRLDEIVTHLKGMVSVSDIDFLKSLKDKVLPQPKQEWSEEDEKQLQHTIAAIQWYAGGIDIIDWLKSLKDRVLQHPQKEWSDEDKRILESVINDIKSLKQRVYCKSACDEEINWLQSLRPQSQWKPSNEQIEALETTLYSNMSRNDERYSVLSEFVAELKKLREE